MSTREAILNSNPVSYWPLDDAASSTSVRDELGLRSGTVSSAGVQLAAVPFGSGRFPLFDGNVDSLIRIPHHERYSHTTTNSLTVACWICPHALNFRHTDGQSDQFVHFIHKGIRYNHNAEWAMRIYNTEGTRPSRLSFYLFNPGMPVCKGAGAYMQFGRSVNDCTRVDVGQWLFLVGQGEEWINACESDTGAIFYKQGVMADRSPGDKYNNLPDWQVRPHSSTGDIAIGGSIGKTAFYGSIAHVALWDRLIAANEVQLIYDEGISELGRAIGRRG